MPPTSVSGAADGISRGELDTSSIQMRRIKGTNEADQRDVFYPPAWGEGLGSGQDVSYNFFCDSGNNGDLAAFEITTPGPLI